MYEKIYKKVLVYAVSVAVGISLIAVAVTFFLLIARAANAWGFKDGNSVSQLYAKQAAAGLACMLGVAGLCGAFAAASRNGVFRIINAALNLTVFACCFGFGNLVKRYAVTLVDYNAIADCLILFYVLAGFTAVLTVFYAVCAVFSYKRPKETQPEVGGGE